MVILMKQRLQSFVILSSLTAIVIHIINRIYHSFHTAGNYLRYPKNNYYEWRFGKIRYTKKGTGSPILLIHDLKAGSSVYEFNKIINALSKDHEVYCIDLLGYGMSDKPNMTYTNYLYVQLVIDFIKNVICKKVDIIATGDSVSITVMACHNDPEVIDKMLFINPQNLYESNQIPSKQTKTFKLLLDTPIIGTFTYNLLTNKSSLEKVFKEEYFYNPLNIEERDILAYLESSHLPEYTSKYVYSSHIGKYMNANIVHALKEINHSIYIIGGDKESDIHTTIENYKYYNSAIESMCIPYTKHLPHLEAPDKTIKCILLFLS